MKILVAIKQVPERDAQVRVGADGRSVDDGGASWTINEPDAYALEEALQLKEREGSGEVVILCAGPERAESTLREALAKGADRALHLVTAEGALEAMDTVAMARLLADAVKAEAPELVLTGLQSDDLGAGQTGVVMAELLGVPHATLVLTVERSGDGLRVKKELEDGWFQHVELPLPALLTIQSGGNRLRYATLMGIKKARAKELRASEATAASASITRLERLSMPEKAKETVMLTGTPDAIATQLIEKLKFEARVL